MKRAPRPARSRHRAALLVLSLLCCGERGQAEGAKDPAAARLTPGSAIERDLAPGETQSFGLDLPAAGAWRLRAVQHGIDVVLELRTRDGRPVAAVDGPFDRQGSESLAWEAPEAGSYLVLVRARERAAPSGRYELRCDPLAATTAEERMALAAELAETRAASGYLAGTPEARRSALQDYRLAAAGWQALGRPAEEARALYAAAVLARLSGDPRGGLELAQRALVLWGTSGDASWDGATWNEVGLDRWLGGDLVGGREAFERALELDRGRGERYGEAVALSNLCLLHLPQGELREGLACYREALPLLRVQGVAELEGAALTNVGRAYDVLGEPAAARDAYGQALERLRATGDRLGEARALNNLGVLEEAAGEAEGALAHYARAREIFLALEDRRWQARVLNNIGLVYHGTGDLEAARAQYEAALPLWRQVEDVAGEASTLTNLGLLRDMGGDAGGALALHRQALALREKAGDKRGQGISLAQIGRSLGATGDLPAALDSLRRAADLLSALGDRSNEAEALRLAGGILVAQGKAEEALPLVERALERARAAASTADEAQGLATLSLVERALGRTSSAIEHSLAALDRIEARRIRIGDPNLRISYSGFQNRAYEQTIDLLLEAHRAHPQAGYDRQALAVSERARARTLLELLDEARAVPHGAAGAPLAGRLRELEDRLSAKAERLSRLEEGSEREALRRESQQIVQEIDLAEAEIRQGDPEVAALTRPRPLIAPEIQRLLDPDTTLLVYSLGTARSALWWVTAEGLELFELPPRAELEVAVRRLHEGWSAYDPERRGAEAEEAASLGRVLLGPVAGRLTGKRIAVVADGILEYLPFGALPLAAADPGAPDEPLLATHEVVVLPSASVLARERQLRAGRTPAPLRLAILADPVFDPADPRLAARPGRKPSPPNAPQPFERLPASRSEALAIAALAPPGETLVALDFDAARERVLGDALAPYRVIHFATHGVLDAEHPALSGLALSTVDREGHPREGFLHLRDIYGLNLAADLVVLSGCRTALGREVRGEGLMGLARGFLSAGAPRVVASLWPVEDRATAALMTRFYRGLWQQGLAPAAALRAAQLEVRKERRWRDPYFWAGFVLEGAWD